LFTLTAKAPAAPNRARSDSFFGAFGSFALRGAFGSFVVVSFFLPLSFAM
jgi:hypothetical protein